MTKKVVILIAGTDWDGICVKVEVWWRVDGRAFYGQGDFLIPQTLFEIEIGCFWKVVVAFQDHMTILTFEMNFQLKDQAPTFSVYGVAILNISELIFKTLVAVFQDTGVTFKDIGSIF